MSQRPSEVKEQQEWFQRYLQEKGVTTSITLALADLFHRLSTNEQEQEQLDPLLVVAEFLQARASSRVKKD